VHGSTRVAVRIAVFGILAFFLARVLASSWDEIGRSTAALRPSWPGLLAASACVIGGYAVLIAAWRLLLSAWQSPLGVVAATRIWFVSSLGKYVPGKVWSIGAMAMLARDAGASPLAATGSAIIMQVVNLAAGFAVVAAAGAGSRELLIAYPVLSAAAWVALVATGIGLAFGPALLTWAVGTAARLIRRPVPALPHLSRTTLLLVFGANTVAWIAYGVGFGLFWTALLGRGGGVSMAALAVYTASYLLGFLALVAPGGLGVRESILIGLLVSLRLASPADAALLAAASRIQLTVLEILPGLILLPGASLRRRSSVTTPDGPTA